MNEDELYYCDIVLNVGGVDLLIFVKIIMMVILKFMIKISYFI